MIKAASYSRISDFEECPYRAKLKYVDKVPEPERELKPGQTEHANDRGSRIHLAAENFVKGQGELTSELTKFEAELVKAQQFYAAGKASTEGDWGFDKHWQPCDWFSKEVTVRTKLDLYVQFDEGYGLVVDHKTGKKFGNEVKHHDQGKFYAVSTFARYPQLQALTVEIWYLDQDDILAVNYSRGQIYNMQPSIQNRIDALLTAKVFPKRANKFTCRWCPYAWFNNGPCEDGIKS